VTEDPPFHAWGRAAIDLLAERLESTQAGWSTDDLAEFWHGATEACTMRLIKLKPELVRPWPPRPDAS